MSKKIRDVEMKDVQSESTEAAVPSAAASSPAASRRKSKKKSRRITSSMKTEDVDMEDGSWTFSVEAWLFYLNFWDHFVPDRLLVAGWPYVPGLAAQLAVLMMMPPNKLGLKSLHRWTEESGLVPVTPAQINLSILILFTSGENIMKIAEIKHNA